MRSMRQFWFGIAPIALLLAACGPAGAPPPDRETGAYVPAWRSLEEQAQSHTGLDQFEQALTTPPPAPVVTNPEWATLAGTLIRWPIGWPEMVPTYLAMLPPLQSEGLLYIVVANKSAQKKALQDIAGCSACNTNNLVWVTAGTNGIWMRDFGPEFMRYSAGQKLGIVDLKYYRTRPKDDAFPQNYAKQIRANFYTTSLKLEGGNFQVDGRGNCFTSRWAAEDNGGEAAVRKIFASHFGCQQTHFIEYMVEEGTHHIDMWMKIVGPTTVLVGDYRYGGVTNLVYPDTVNADILDQAAAQMAALGFEVVRIPQPTSYFYSDFDAYTIRTYTNSTMANNTILIPIFNEPTDATALAIYDQVLPASITEVGIDSRYIIDYGGAMHCITMERHL